MSWWDITSRDPFFVCAAADDLAQKNTIDALEGRKDGFGAFTDRQRDDLAWTARWDAAGAYIMSGMTYRLVYVHRRLWFVTATLVGLNNPFYLSSSSPWHCADRALMNEAPSQNTRGGCLGTLVIVSSVIVGATLGGFWGHEEVGLLGSILGVLAGGFVGLIAGMLLNLAIALSLVAFIILGPLALLLFAVFWFVDTYG